MDVLLSVQQVAGILHTSESTVRRMEEKKDLATFSDGQYRFGLANVLSVRSEKSNLKTKFMINGIKSKDLKDIVDKFSDDETISFIVEEFDQPGETASEYLVPKHKGFVTIGIYGQSAGKSWII